MVYMPLLRRRSQLSYIRHLTQGHRAMPRHWLDALGALLPYLSFQWQHCLQLVKVAPAIDRALTDEASLPSVALH